MQVGEVKGLTSKARNILERAQRYRAKADDVAATDATEARRLREFADELEHDAKDLANIALKLSKS